MARKYFKDLAFQIAFFHHPGGISLEEVDGFFVNKVTKESAVISARGARRIKNPDWYPISASEVPMREIFQDIECDRKFGDGSLVSHIQKNHPETYDLVMRWANGYSTDRLIILSHGDSEFPQDFNPELSPVDHREGGVELVVEYLLSNFASAEVINLPKRWVREDGTHLTPEEEKQMEWEQVESMAVKGYRFDGWKYDFSTSDNFHHLEPLYSDLVDDEYATYEDYERFLYKVDNKAVGQMSRWVSIPYKLYAILTSEQKQKWRDKILPEIILCNLDFIGIDLFGLSLNNASRDAADSHIRASAASWDAELGEQIKHDKDE